MATLWSDTHTLVSDLLSLMCHNSRERRARVYWVEDYEMSPMHFLRRPTLDLNTWCISVKEEVVDTNLPRMSVLRFDLDMRTLDLLHMPPPEALNPGTPAP